MPVGTRATVKGVLPRDLKEMGASVLLANAFHLASRPGAETVAKLGGLHEMMQWDGPILTDSGGYQIFSLAKIRKIDRDGVSFRDPLDGTSIRFTPESCMELQRTLGADFIMALDVCPGGDAPRAEIESAVEQSLHWAQRCIADHRAHASRDGAPFLLGIAQGGIHADLRASCARELIKLNFDGYAIGGLSVGESKDGMRRALDATAPILPKELPRYLMGVGHPADFVDAIERGVDLFDCVSPTREGRNARAFTSAGYVHIRNAALAADRAPLDAECECYCCRRYSRGTLRHLFQVNEMLGPILLSMHNLSFFLKFMERARAAIQGGQWSAFAGGVRAVYGADAGTPDAVLQ